MDHDPGRLVNRHNIGILINDGKGQGLVLQVVALGGCVAAEAFHNGRMIASNPFSTRYVQPGSIPFQLRDGMTFEQLFERFLEIPSRRAAIVGPHGSGKSSLLETMRKSIPVQYEVDAHRLSSESTRFDRTHKRWGLDSERWGPQTIVIVDGFEQLSWWAQYKLKCLVRNRESRLLVTTHYLMRGFPLLWTTQRTLDDDDYVLRQLLVGRWSTDGQSSHTAEAFHMEESCHMAEAMIRWQEVRLRYPTDMREALMEMYDWWEKKKRPTTFDSCRPFLDRVRSL